MIFKWMLRRYMEQAGGEGGAGGTATTTAATTTEAGTTEAAATAATTAATSLLATGADAAAAGGTDFIPEKLRVMKEDGTLDLDASGRKMAEAYTALEKRMGTGDAPPKAASEYQITVPDALKEAFDPATDQGIQKFLSSAVTEGMTQKQIDLVMSTYFELAPQLAAGAQQYDATTATEELKKTWATDADFKRNVQNAHTATNAAAQKAGLSLDDVMSGQLGNNPQFLRLMAALGPEYVEDPGAGGQAVVSHEDVNSLMASEAYTNERHVDHKKVSEKVRKFFERKAGTEAAA